MDSERTLATEPDSEPWLSLCRLQCPFLDRTEKELVEGLGARVRAGPARTEGTDPWLMYHLWKEKLQNLLCRHSRLKLTQHKFGRKSLSSVTAWVLTRLTRSNCLSRSLNPMGIRYVQMTQTLSPPLPHSVHSVNRSKNIVRNSSRWLYEHRRVARLLPR
jgi:hypothetical protein